MPKRDRLSPNVIPTEVDLEVEVDPSASTKYSGQVTHHISLNRSRRSIELHACEITVSRARIRTKNGSMRGRIVKNVDRQRIEVIFPEIIPSGKISLTLSFRGKLRNDLRGLYAAESGSNRYAFTQLEATDARRFFPCFDEPDKKSRFSITVTTGFSNSVISNTSPAAVDRFEEDKKRVRFHRTQPLSTYLLALCIGKMSCSDIKRSGNTDIRVWSVPEKAGMADFALEVAHESLERLETYFDLAYPYEKLDLVAVPDFDAGAMDNAGAVFFRESLLLIDRSTATLQEQKRVAEVICHELAHMWYGNLVTMAWWDDLWLNEAFATWMAFRTIDAWKPEWSMWQDFQHYRFAAFATDALIHTHPIYTSVNTPEQATENFDVITYEKGASVVRMLEQYLGASIFRDGVRRYITRHREKNARASDLWQALSEASGQEIEPIIRAWIEQPGFPFLKIRRTLRKGKQFITFRQDRFLIDSSKTEQKPPTTWPIPWVGQLGLGKQESSSVRKLIKGKSGSLMLRGKKPKFIYGNAEEAGFFRPIHSDEELKLLRSHRSNLSPVERLGLIGHQWAAVRANQAKIRSFLELVTDFNDEQDPDVLLGLIGPLSFIGDRLASLLSDKGKQYRHRIGKSFLPAFTEVGFDPKKGEGDRDRLRRAALLKLVTEVGHDLNSIRSSSERCRLYLKDRQSLDPNLGESIVKVAARGGDEKLYKQYLTAIQTSQTPQEKRRFQFGLTAFCKHELIERTLNILLSNQIDTQDVAILLARILENPEARRIAWNFMMHHWKPLRSRMPAKLVTLPIETLPVLGTRKYRREVSEFFHKNPIPTGARTFRQTLERFDLDLQLERRAISGLEEWLRH